MGVGGRWQDGERDGYAMGKRGRPAERGKREVGESGWRGENADSREGGCFAEARR